MPVMPDEAEWALQRAATDLTSGSLRRQNRRGMPLMPDEAGWIVKRCAADLTSRSLRGADAAIVSLRNGPDMRDPSRF